MQRFANSKHVLIAVTMSLGTSHLGPAVAQHRSAPVLVRRVIDGDTIDVASIGRVRLLGVVAPKIDGRSNLRPTSLAQEAQQRLSGLLANRWVRLEYESSSGGGSSRAAYVFLEDGRFVNEWVVREGLGRVTGGKKLTRLNALERAEGEAKAARRGIWAEKRAIEERISEPYETTSFDRSGRRAV